MFYSTMEMEMEMETYRECMRNHAATLGTYATDGCGEYTSDPSSPGGFHCAACGCHRNFHRKVLQAPAADAACDSLALTHSPSASAEGGRLRRTRTRFTAEQKEKMFWFAEKIRWRIPREGGGGGNDEVGRFCREIGVARQVFKVWMHNHKTNGGGSGGCGGGGGAVSGAGGGGGGGRSSSTPPSSSTSTATTTTTGTAATGTTTGTASEANVSSLTQ